MWTINTTVYARALKMRGCGANLKIATESGEEMGSQHLARI
jgi:hypothetical protein